MIRVWDSSFPVRVRKLVSPIWIRISESFMPSIDWAAISKIIILIIGVVELLVREFVNLGISHRVVW